MTVPERLEALRKQMEEKKIDVYVVPTADFHQSEYVGNISRRESSSQDFLVPQGQQSSQRQRQDCGQTDVISSRLQSSWRDLQWN